jgi:mono/diheme cytochrome c family protein
MMRYLFAVTALVVFLGVTACSGGSTDTTVSPAKEINNTEQQADGDPAVGQTLFTETCAACHGPAGEGIEGLGKDMTVSSFIAQKTNDELIDFLKVGRPPGDPLNSTGIAMPAYGGNTGLSDTDLHNLVAYIRTLQS